MSPAAVALGALVVAFAVSTLVTRRLSRAPYPFSRMIDLPNERSLHTGVLPRTGGVAIGAALLVCAPLALVVFPLPTPLLWILGALLLVGGISFLDDQGEVRARYRLAAHLGAGLLLLRGGVAWSGIELPGLYRELPQVLSWLLTLGYLVWMVNLVLLFICCLLLSYLIQLSAL